MSEILIHALGGLCISHMAWMLLRLGQRREAQACHSRTGRPMRIRLDRRRKGRRSSDA